MAWLAGEAFYDQSLTLAWPWGVSDLDVFKQGWSWVITFVPIGAISLIGFLLTWRLYKEKFGKKQTRISRYSKPELDING
jgi:hypothetical protein